MDDLRPDDGADEDREDGEKRGVWGLAAALLGVLAAGVHDIPESQDQELAGLKLRTLGVEVDRLTPEQIRYQDDYASGT